MRKNFGAVIDDPEAGSAVLPTLLRFISEVHGVADSVDMPMRDVFAFGPNSDELLPAIIAVLEALRR